ncbi:response regulator [Flavobacterium sp. UBA6031]|uniref:response regulator n=1 Tax=Flavobacterium sp. UBA6031 TaxID=1946551 RepID=UPI0025BC05AA|nr:response regulator [Flavobacterium sp. UBA6031]
MTEQNLQSVLLIDDHSSSYLSALQPTAEVAGFELFATDNVLDGINYIKKYTEIVSAVVLDLNFPRGEMQGLEALQKIKILQPELPVIMLTDNDSASDIDRVVECMKKGAYNYIGKRTLNPVYLFQVVEAAVQQAKLQERIKKINNIPDKTYRFHTVKKTEGDFLQSTSYAIFGFELISLNKASNENEATNLEKTAIMWHQNLIKSLSTIYCNNLKINLKYISENYKTKCIILFTVSNESDESLDRIINSLQHDINTFFSTNIKDTNQPYIFEELIDSDFLLNTNTHSEDYYYNVFFRQPIHVKEKKSMGFNQTDSSTNDDGSYKPDKLFPLPTKFHYDNDLFSALKNQKEYVEIDIELTPRQLLKEELDLIQQVINDTSLLEIKKITSIELEQFAEYLQKFIARTKDKFLVGVMLKSKSSNSLHHLRISTINYFFGFNESVICQERKHHNLLRYFISTDLIFNRIPFFYSIDDALQIFRFPIPSLTDLPGLTQQSHNFHYYPDNLTPEGIQLGIKNISGKEQEIRIDKESLARHLYIMGQTGTGKSTMLKTMISDCLDKNYGFTIIDPHGDLFDQILKLIPKNKKNKVFIIDTTDTENSLKFNPLLYDENMPQAKSLVVNEILNAIDSLYDLKQTGGPMFELYFKNALFLLLDEVVVEKFGKATLANMLNVFLDEDFRRERLLVCGTKNVTQFFKNAVVTSGDASFSNIANYITSKLTRFVEDFYLAPLLNSETNNIDFRKIIDEGNIFMVKMDKGLIGSTNTSFLGQIILSKLFLAGMSRTNISIDERKPHYIFIDEFQNFVKGDVGTALSEVRKYGLNLILANQTLGQLDNYMIQSLLGNVGSMVFFRPGVYDYEKLMYYLEPDFKREDVLKLPNFNCIARLMINNIPSDPFVFQTKID